MPFNLRKVLKRNSATNTGTSTAEGSSAPTGLEHPRFKNVDEMNNYLTARKGNSTLPTLQSITLQQSTFPKFPDASTLNSFCNPDINSDNNNNPPSKTLVLSAEGMFWHSQYDPIYLKGQIPRPDDQFLTFFKQASQYKDLTIVIQPPLVSNHSHTKGLTQNKLQECSQQMLQAELSFVNKIAHFGCYYDGCQAMNFPAEETVSILPSSANTLLAQDIDELVSSCHYLHNSGGSKRKSCLVYFQCSKQESLLNAAEKVQSKVSQSFNLDEMPPIIFDHLPHSNSKDDNAPFVDIESINPTSFAVQVTGPGHHVFQ